MCCFTQPVISVSATKIFARAGEGDRQFLVYSMTLEARNELAMVLPLPVKVGTDEKGVTFIDLKGYPNFFDDLDRGFPRPVTTKSTRGVHVTELSAAAPLQVIQVGNFEASFVPSLKDFSRLDKRFQITDRAWKKLPQYGDFGFAVFKLKSGEAKIHPMAFSFPRRDLRSIFFPTVHIHDGEVHDSADFDHVLCCQPSEHEPLQTRGWEESTGHAARFMKMEKVKGIVGFDQHCYKKELRGKLPNKDTYVSIAA